MTEDEALFAHASDLKTQCALNSVLQSTAFLDLRQRTLLLPLEKSEREYVKTFYYGGYEDAERVCCVFVPSFFEEETPFDFFENHGDENPLSLLRLQKDRFTSLSHRDYLGALMGLGLKREMLGDIITDENGCFLFCLSSVAGFVEKSLESAGRASVKASRVDLSELVLGEERTKELFFSVSSLRLDSVLSCAFSLARSKACAFIEGGSVFLNGVQTEKPDKKVAPGDKLVLRGKGKAVLAEVRGESKKGRTHIIIKKYL